MNFTEINPFTLPSRLLSDRRSLPQCQAIYFVIDEDSILYIGRTANLAERWIAHHRFNQLETNPRIAWLECSNEDLLPELERALIKHFSPLLNGTDVVWETKKAKITFTCSHELRDELEAIAEQEDRTLSKLVERLVTKALLDYKKTSSREQKESA
jgi:GIY-YIG catalytic domain